VFFQADIGDVQISEGSQTGNNGDTYIAKICKSDIYNKTKTVE